MAAVETSGLTKRYGEVAPVLARGVAGGIAAISALVGIVFLRESGRRWDARLRNEQ